METTWWKYKFPFICERWRWSKWGKAGSAVLPGWHMGELLLEPDTLAGEISSAFSRLEDRVGLNDLELVLNPDIHGWGIWPLQSCQWTLELLKGCICSQESAETCDVEQKFCPLLSGRLLSCLDMFFSPFSWTFFHLNQGCKSSGIMCRLSALETFSPLLQNCCRPTLRWQLVCGLVLFISTTLTWKRESERGFRNSWHTWHPI